MKNVLIVASSGMGSTGVPNVIAQVVKTQMNNFRFFVLVFNDDNYYYPLLKKANAKIIKIRSYMPNGRFGKLLWHLIKKYGLFKKEIKKIVRENSIDIIHCFKEEESWPFLKAARDCGVKTRIVHCNSEFKRRDKILPRFIALKSRKKTNKFGNVFVGGSKKCCESLFLHHNFEVIHYTYNENLFNMGVKNRLTNQLVLTQVATFSSNKNQLFSIKIAKAIANIGIKCHLNLVGFSNEAGYEDKMKALISDLNVQDSVSIIDGSGGVGTIMEYTTFFLLPSFSEGAPLTLIEAQACGIHCFASDSVTNEIDCGGITFLSINESPDVWCKAIIERFVNKGNNRHHYDVSEFSKNNFSNKIKNIYR